VNRQKHDHTDAVSRGDAKFPEDRYGSRRGRSGDSLDWQASESIVADRAMAEFVTWLRQYLREASGV
jgi:hypothetical protein